MKGMTLGVRAYPRRLLAVAGAIVLVAGLGGIALAASASSRSSVIDGCYNKTTGALRVITAHSKTCGSQAKISWNKAGPAGNGYAFTSTAGSLNVYDQSEADGQVITKKGTYFVNVNANLNISAYTAASSGFCALDLVKGSTPSETYLRDIFSAWAYSYAGSANDGVYPESTSGMVSAPAAGYRLALFCYDSSANIVAITSATWLVSPVSATASSTAAIARHLSTTPAGFRPKPALTARSSR
jgi:hypothetical protein